MEVLLLLQVQATIFKCGYYFSSADTIFKCGYYFQVRLLFLSAANIQARLTIQGNIELNVIG